MKDGISDEGDGKVERDKVPVTRSSHQACINKYFTRRPAIRVNRDNTHCNAPTVVGYTCYH
jgi:hypothetical protein